MELCFVEDTWKGAETGAIHAMKLCKNWPFTYIWIKCPRQRIKNAVNKNAGDNGFFAISAVKNVRIS